MKGWYFFLAAVAVTFFGGRWFWRTGSDIAVVLILLGVFLLPALGIVFGLRNVAQKLNTPERIAAREAQAEKRREAARIVSVKVMGEYWKTVPGDGLFFRRVFTKKVLVTRFAVLYADGHVGFAEAVFGSGRYEELMSHIGWEEIGE